MKRLFILIFPVLLLISCYTRYSNTEFIDEFNFKDSTITIAVLNFEYSGSFISSKHSKLIADLVTSELFIEKKINVIDRSLVKNVLKKYANAKTGRFSREEIQNIGMELKATHIALGNLISMDSIEDFYELGSRRIDISMRILDSGTGNVMGILRQQQHGRENIEELIKIAVREMLNLIAR